MPIYEYVCRACGHQTEALQKMSDAPLSVCPSCSQAALARKISAAGFRLKGGGWYETDFKKGGKRNVAGDAGEPAAKTDKPEKTSEKSDKAIAAEKTKPSSSSSGDTGGSGKSGSGSGGSAAAA